MPGRRLLPNPARQASTTVAYKGKIAEAAAGVRSPPTALLRRSLPWLNVAAEHAQDLHPV
jgi:hypothetical protein